MLNPLCADVEVNDARLEKSLANEDLCTGLVEQPTADNDKVYHKTKHPSSA